MAEEEKHVDRPIKRSHGQEHARRSGISSRRRQAQNGRHDRPASDPRQVTHLSLSFSISLVSLFVSICDMSIRLLDWV